MKLTDAQIIQLIKQPKNKKLIQLAVNQKNKAELHIRGFGLEKFLQKVDKVENQDYIDLKKKLTNKITVAVYDNALRPVSQLNSGKGGSVSYNLRNENALKNLQTFIKSNIYDGYDLNEYIEKVWSEYGIWCDPIGMTYIDVIDNELDLKYISLSDNDFVNYHDISYISMDYIDYVIFAKGEITIKNIQYDLFEVVDEARIIQVVRKKSDKNYIKILPETQRINIFGFVPAVLNSNKISKEDLKLYGSYAEESFIIADNFLNDFADYRIYKKKLGIPRFWEFKQQCTECQGVGQIQKYNEVGEGGFTLITCPKCNGTRFESERSLTDILRLDIFTKDYPNMIPPTGAVTMPVDIQQLMITEINDMKIEIFETIWGSGTYVDKERKDTTAFEVSVRNELKNSRLQSLEKNRTKYLEKIITIIGKYFMQDSFESVIVRPNNKFVINSSSEGLQLYFEAKTRNATAIVLDRLYLDYIDAEYQNDIIGYDRAYKLLRCNPAPHYDIIVASQYLTAIQLLIKTNFERYIEMFENAYGRIESPENTIEKIYNQLIIFAENEKNTSETQSNRSRLDV